ncbi:MAG TPA: response regulator transcription factor [Streptosporangiaceae bacterium]|nr:response regulator transcription factor [Streptosporangiaceae bacterium]
MIKVTNIVVGDGQKVFLDALAMVLRNQGFTVNTAQTEPEVLAAVARHRPDVCLIDRHFGRGDSPDMIGRMITGCPSTKVIVLSADPDTDGVLEALKGGASGYVHKTRGVTALTTAIQRALRGEVVVDVPKTAGARSAPQRYGMQRLAAFLTTRERQCLQLLVDGQDTAQMATRLGVSRATVRTHVQSLLTKLGAHSRLEAASLAVRYKLLEDQPAA